MVVVVVVVVVVMVVVLLLLPLLLSFDGCRGRRLMMMAVIGCWFVVAAWVSVIRRLLRHVATPCVFWWNPTACVWVCLRT